MIRAAAARIDPPMAPPSVWTTPGVRGLVADVDDTVVVLLGPAVVVSQALQVVDQAIGDEDAAGVPLAKGGFMFGG